MKKKGEPPGPPFGEMPSPANLQDPSSYSVLAFELHKFDVTENYKGDKKDTAADALNVKKDSEHMKEAIVAEMY
jgi:hypothetical protein